MTTTNWAKYIIELVPFPLNTDGWGYWCTHCKKFLHPPLLNPGDSHRLRPMLTEHTRMHKRKMREQI